MPPTLPSDRLAVGQLLVRLLRHFRTTLFEHPDRVARHPDLRFAHLQIWGNIGVDGVRLTELANRANLSLAACSELVDDLERLGYLDRRPDPTDGRAKLITPSDRGRELLQEAGRAVARLEEHWRQLCHDGAFDAACRTLNHLLAELDETRPTPP